jgi:hypothetical protein
MQSERSGRRARTAINAEFRAGNVQGKGKIRNVGEGGLFLETSSLPPQGEQARIRFTAPTGPIVVSGLVWWTTARRRARSVGFGFRLLEANRDFDTLVRGLLKRAS